LHSISTRHGLRKHHGDAPIASISVAMWLAMMMHCDEIATELITQFVAQSPTLLNETFELVIKQQRRAK
jgi:hypothetical protein